MDTGAVHRLETTPEGRRLAHRLGALSNDARLEFTAAVCEATLVRADVADAAPMDALVDIRSGVASESLRLAVTAIGNDLDEAAWDLADRDDRRYPAAFRRARAVAAVNEALGAGDDALLETVYEAHQAGLSLREIAQLLDSLTPPPE
jgi:hypothetical protein